MQYYVSGIKMILWEHVLLISEDRTVVRWYLPVHYWWYFIKFVSSKVCYWLWWHGRWFKQEKDDSTCCFSGTMQGELKTHASLLCLSSMEIKATCISTVWCKWLTYTLQSFSPSLPFPSIDKGAFNKVSLGFQPMIFVKQV